MRYDCAVRHSSDHIRQSATNFRGLALTVIMAALALLANGEHAAAESRTCRQLRAQLETLPSGLIDEPTLYRRYDRAVAEQRQELGRARDKARSGGCTQAIGAGSDQCQATTLKIVQMETNLADLQRKRGRLAGGTSGELETERRRLRAELDAKDCFAGTHEDQAAGIGVQQEGSLFDRLEGSVRITSPSNPFDDDAMLDEEAEELTSYRTICVRTCDGYYFPMSPASTRDDFQRDQQNCESICPGAEIRTYYQEQGVDDADTMMSAATEELYSDLPTSHRYKRRDIAESSQCTCASVAAPQSFSVIAGETDIPDGTKSPESPIPTPDAAAVRAIRAPKPANSAERRIRAVGPAFLPDPSAAAAPPAPAPTPAR